MRTSTLILALSLAACGEDGPPPVAPQPAPSASPEQQQAKKETQSHMKTHFMKAYEAKDAVIRGDLEKARAPLTWLAEHDDAAHATEAWKPYIASMRAAAKDAAAAPDLTTAATGIANVARTCGDCHAKVPGGPSFAGNAAPPESDDPKAHMQRHKWAADRMWEGLVAPDDKAWIAGATALHDASLTVEGASDKDVAKQSLADHVHEVAGRPASSAEDRVAVFAQVLASCSACHVGTGGGPQKHGGSRTE